MIIVRYLCILAVLWFSALSCGPSGVGQVCESDDACAAGNICENGVCQAGQCSEVQPCKDGLLCKAHRCKGCIEDTECGSERICEKGSCIATHCSAQKPCSDGKVCDKGRCIDCVDDSVCGSEYICDKGRCIDACSAQKPCSDGKICDKGRCVACENDGECANSERICESGRCIDALCSEKKPCSDGKICDKGRCVACKVDADCGNKAWICEQGICVEGCRDSKACANDWVCDLDKLKCVECLKNSDCKDHKICTNKRCEPCAVDKQCESGYLCVEGRCRKVDCRQSEDCSDGKLCKNYLCVSCVDKSDDRLCGEGKICEQSKCRIGCRETNDCRSPQVCDMSDLLCKGCIQNADCKGGLICNKGVCNKCSDDIACGTGKLCINEVCREGVCRDNSACKGGEVCRNYNCLPCLADIECAKTEICIQGQCIAGDCRTSADCSDPAKAVCKNHRCEPCSAHSECGLARICAEGLCVQGNCHKDKPCTGGLICKNYNCTNCAAHSDCDSDQVCAVGRCHKGNCITDADCVEPKQPICRQYTCSACQNDGECPRSTLCINGQCQSGVCRSNADCVGGLICKEYQCANCKINADCSQTEVCANGLCKQGNCVTHSDCVEPSKPICAENVCRPCSADSECSSGLLCIQGECKKGNCRVDSDCGSGMSCQNYTCVIAAFCDDNIQNGLETDVDCGGNCPPCAERKKCLQHSDCQTSFCAGNKTCGCLCTGSHCPDLISHWPLDEGTGTSTWDSIRRNDGVLHNNPVWENGKLGKALRFTGNNHVAIPDAPELDMHTGDLTVSAWVKIPVGQKAQRRIVAHGTHGSPGYHGFSLMQWCGWGNLSCGSVAFLLGVNNSGEWLIGTCQAMDDGQWHHYAATVKRSGSIEFYVDGKRLNSPCAATNWGAKWHNDIPGDISHLKAISIDSPCDLCLGASCQNAGKCGQVTEYFVGSIDQVSLHKRALSFLEIRQQYNQSYGDLVCSRSCSQDGDCSAAQLCINNVCRIANCRIDQDCFGGQICQDNQCVTAPKCDDQIENGLETDVDCGGNCPPCALHKQCLKDSDCQSQYCDANNRCACRCNAPICQDLVSHWPLDEGSGTVTRDALRPYSTGTLHNAPAWESGKLGMALRFSGSNYVVIPDSDDLDPRLGDFSVSAWIKIPAGQKGQRRIIAHGTHGQAYNGFALMQWCAWGQVPCGGMGFLLGINGQNEWLIGTCQTMDDGQWHHYVAVMDRKASLSFYVDGQKVANPCYGITQNGKWGNNTPGDISHLATIDINSPCNLCLGTSCQNGGTCGQNAEFFIGSLDQVSIYKRALSAQDVTQLYNSGKGLAICE